MTDPLRKSEKGVELLKSIETLATEPYDDQTGEKIDRWVKGATIGYGHLILQDQWERYRDGITEAEASELFGQDLQPFLDAINRAVTLQLQYVYYWDMTWTVGYAAIATFEAA